ncbi:3',5'-cyclic-nucleotide phosphodiesterase [Limnobacter sp.]|uniref:3',5'-cyclic-nucleotide phosphodiesterase n=1 Tax=Limnobacter sp. TaxID=2003368 RepID=UPI0035133362
MHKHSTVEVLGCSGSIGIPGQGTTSFLIDDDILIDAGTGLCELEFDRLEKIEHVILTHSHLDHICGLPFMVDTVGVGRNSPLKVYASKPTLDALKQHVFNHFIWPDFTRIPSADNPVMVYQEISPEQVLHFGKRQIQVVEVAHTVPAIGVFLFTPTGGWCFSGDTHQTDRLFDLINATKKVDYLFIEAAFPDKEKWLADLAKHLCPSLLFDELKKITVPGCEVWISHLKPKDRTLIEHELQQYPGAQPLRILSAGMTFTI